MRYILRKETEIIPFDSKNQVKGIIRGATVEFTTEEAELSQVIIIDGIEYYKLPLGENNSKYDSYLVATDSLTLDSDTT